MTDSPAENEWPTAEVTLMDRTITVKYPSPTQVSLLRQSWMAVMKVGAANDPERTLQAVARCLNVLQAMAVNPADQVWLEECMYDGSLDVQELTKVFLEPFQEKENRAEKRRATRAKG